MVRITRTCPKCNGEGVDRKDTKAGIKIIDPCPQCLGSGKIDMMDIDLSDMDAKLDELISKVDAIWNVLPSGWKGQ